MDARGWLRPSLLHLNELSPIIWILRLKGNDRDLALKPMIWPGSKVVRMLQQPIHLFKSLTVDLARGIAAKHEQ
jgi:hypothetical protein